ncbi:hypothetical protein M378DRAFT_131439 [Amanita muscaria Koide BX008]|uniref:Cyclin-like domain-containing protein n=1 Tax=Amanita muscaria (strain Koide BX008) TaxID=946122 RepID=A0A0C2SZI3_AMAMK|nr:hypothetical protein M378DRAFT_131439 [Amanita muscaria Koide BX008]
MAADFWSSSHYKRWMVDRASINQARAVDILYVDNHDPEYFDFLNIYFANAIMKLGRRLSLRQRVIATAIIFFKRFYLKNSYCETDPFLVIAACCYLAAKAEECPVSIKQVALESKAHFSQEIHNVKSTNFDHTRIAEMEFYLVDDLESDLTIYHPYRTLTALCKPDPSSSSSSNTNTATTNNTNPTLPDTEPEEGEAIEYPSPSSGTHSLNPSLNHPIDEGPRYWGTGQGQLELPDGGFQRAWFIINDTYRSNICLIYPPHLIAVAAICLTVVFHPPSRSEIVPHLPSSSSTAKVGQPPDTILTFLASLNVSFPLVATIIQEIVSLWTLWDRYKEDATDTSSAASSASPGGSAGKMSSMSPTKPHQQQLQRLARGSTATLSTLSTSTPTPTAGGGDDPACTTDNNDSSSSHSPLVEEPAILFTPSILSNVLVKMREGRLAIQQATSSNSGSSSSNNNTDGGSNNPGSGSTTPGMGKAANKMLERAQAAG